MQRQVFGPHPVTGIVCHHYRDLGPAQVTELRGMPIVPRTSLKAVTNAGRISKGKAA